MKNKKTKKIPLWKTLTVFSLLLGVFVAVGYATFVVDDPVVTTSDSTATSGETEDKEKVKVDFRYQICDGMIVTTYQEEALGDVNGTTYELGTEYAIDNSSSYNAFQDLMETLTGNRPGDLPSGNHQYPGIGDWSNDYIILSVTAEIKFTDGGTCGSDSYEGKYKISKQQKEKSTYRYSYDTDIKFSTDLDSGDTLSDLRSLIMDHLNEVSAGYTFVGFKETVYDAEDNPLPSDSFLSEDTTIESDSSYYLVLNSDNDLSDYKNNLSDTITSTQTGVKTFNAQAAQGSENVTNDLSYFEGDKAVFLTHATTIHEGVTINFGLNDGSIKKDATTTSFSNFEPENDAHELQYKVVLQEDMVIDGTLVIGSNYGVANSQAANGLITNEYVCLDLNGHDITINSTGSLLSYGLIKDSKGTGTIFVEGGSIQTLATIQDYRGGGATSGMVSGIDKCFPFEVYSLPYLRCHVRLETDSNNSFGQFLALAHINYMGSSQTEIVLNFIGPEGGDSFLFSISNPQSESFVDIYGYSHKAMEEDPKMTDADRQAVLSKRMEIQLNNVQCNMNALKFTISVPIDTSEFIFPISGFFDIMLRSSTIVISQRIKFMPGSSFFANENSVVSLSYNGQRSAQVLALGNNFYYYDSQYEKFVNNDYMDGGEGSQGRQYRRSEAFAKYFSSPRISIYGTLAIRQGNAGSNSSPYILAGNINFNRVAYYSDDLSALTYVDYEERENPFTELVSDSLGTTSISTYYFSTMLGSVTGFPSYKTYFCKGYSLPLVSNGLCYYQNATDTDGVVGTFDSRTGEMLFNGSHYVIESTKSYSSAPREDGSCSLLKVTKDSALPVYQDENGEQYIFFAGMYCKFSSSTDSTGEADCSRLTDTTQKTAVKFDSSLNRWVRA